MLGLKWAGPSPLTFTRLFDEKSSKKIRY